MGEDGPVIRGGDQLQIDRAVGETTFMFTRRVEERSCPLNCAQDVAPGSYRFVGPLWEATTYGIIGVSQA
jgi:hypothetical protein